MYLNVYPQGQRCLCPLHVVLLSGKCFSHATDAGCWLVGWLNEKYPTVRSVRLNKSARGVQLGLYFSTPAVRQNYPESSFQKHA